MVCICKDEKVCHKYKFEQPFDASVQDELMKSCPCRCHRIRPILCSMCQTTHFDEAGCPGESGLPGEHNCQKPPAGWWCSRHPGHPGPCAARPLGDV